MTLRNVWLILPFVALLSVGCGTFRGPTESDEKPHGIMGRGSEFGTKSAPNDQSPQSSDSPNGNGPAAGNALDSLAGNKFDSWTISPRIDLPLGYLNR